MAAVSEVIVDQAGDQAGLQFWMRRVLEEYEQVSLHFAPDPVHDLRVAIRRCRSMADGMMKLDPHPAWRKMKKAGKQLFACLGELRDSQVMLEWILRLDLQETPGGRILGEYAREPLKYSPIHRLRG